MTEEIRDCRLCPRLVAWREQIAAEKRKSFANDVYWGRPVPDFGDPDSDRLIVGLAPAAHGANRTGRMFTGDRSGDWLFAALHRAGIANQPTSVSATDGLQLRGALITACVHCAPPDNKPTPAETQTCGRYLASLLGRQEWKSILCLGSTAWNQVFAHLKVRPRPRFGHGVVVSGLPRVVGSYHPSQQNTFTGKLTEGMLDEAVAKWLA